MRDDASMPELRGVLLAGGKSSRMGRDKALLTIDGECFIARIARRLRTVAGPPLLVSSHARRYAFLEFESCADIYNNAGPLGGIHAAFHRTMEDRLLVVACDVPFLTVQALRCLCDHAREADIVYAATAEVSQPLVGIYARDVLPALEHFLMSGRRRLHDFLRECDSMALRLDRHVDSWDQMQLHNINTPGDCRGSAYHRSP